MACPFPTYLQASFKGVPFECLTGEAEVGRRGAEGEFPFGEQTAYADLGRKIRTYKITGRTTGSDHVILAQALLAACESVGPGTLVHPTRGILQVACKKATFKDDIHDAAGVTEIELEFVEANDFTAGLSGLGAALLDFVGLSNGVIDAFVTAYDFVSAPFYDKPSIGNVVSGTLNLLDETLKSSFGTQPNKQAWIISDQLQVAARSVDVAKSPQLVIGGIQAGLNAIDLYGTSSTVRFDAFLSLARKSTQYGNTNTSFQRAQEAVTSAMRILSTAYLARTAVERPVSTLQEALEIYDKVIRVIEEEEQAARIKCEDQLFLKLRAFKAQTHRVLLDAAYRKPPIIAYDFHGVVPSLVAAHEIYGNGKRFLEIEARNAHMWPWAMGNIIHATRN